MNIYIYIYYVYYICSIYVFADVVPNPGRSLFESALNRVLILAQECRGKMVQNRTGIMDLQNKSNILVAKQ